LAEKFKVLAVMISQGDEELCWTDRPQLGRLVRQLLLRLTSQVYRRPGPVRWRDGISEAELS
jgi:hypothetical protein